MFLFDLFMDLESWGRGEGVLLAFIFFEFQELQLAPFVCFWGFKLWVVGCFGLSGIASFESQILLYHLMNHQ